MKWSRILTAALLAGALTALLAGCGPFGAADTQAKRVAVFLPDTAARWTTDKEYLQRNLEELGYVASVEMAGEPAVQQQQIAKCLEGDPDCLIVAPLDSKGVAGVLAAAKEKKIPVVSYDRLIMDTDAVSYYATFDNEGVGLALGRYIEEKLRLKSGAGPYHAELFAGSSNDNNAVLVHRGFMKVLQPYLANGQLVCLSGQTNFAAITTNEWSSELAQQRMAQLAQQYYSGGARLDLVVSPSDGIANGIVAGLEQAGYQGPWPFITGQDGEKEAVARVRDGRQGCTLYKSTALLADKCVKMVKAVLENSQPELNDLETYDNGVIKVPAYLCTPVIIEKENIERELGKNR